MLQNSMTDGLSEVVLLQNSANNSLSVMLQNSMTDGLSEAVLLQNSANNGLGEV